MTISLRDGAKLFGIAVMSGCAVFVCTFFLNFYLDARGVRELVEESVLPLYEAQILTAKVVCLISGCCLLLVSVILLIFYVKLYIDSHARQLGILKAMGYGSGRISLGFRVFGLSVLIGTATGHGCGYAISPLIYTKMGGKGLPDIPLHFHGELLALLVILPTAAFAALAIGAAYLRLRKSALSLMRGREGGASGGKPARRDLPFLQELRRATLKSRKALVFFVGFACFCFSSMLQMSASMKDLSSETMGAIIFGIGIVLAATALILAFTSLVTANARSVAVMRAHGYTLLQCGGAVLGRYRIPAYIGFALGTLYQYGLLKLMVGVVFRGIGEVPPYSFDWAVFGIVLAVFAVLFECAVLWFTRMMGKSSVKQFTVE